MVLSRLLRAGEHKTVRRLRAIADHINGLEPDVTGLSDAELRAKTDEFRRRPQRVRPAPRASTTCCPRRTPWFARQPSAPWASGTSTSS
jgi:preprotein translocase subunit SecA